MTGILSSGPRTANLRRVEEYRWVIDLDLNGEHVASHTAKFRHDAFWRALMWLDKGVSK